MRSSHCLQGYYRKGMALIGLGMLKSAKTALLQVRARVTACVRVCVRVCVCVCVFALVSHLNLLSLRYSLDFAQGEALSPGNEEFVAALEVRGCVHPV